MNWGDFLARPEPRDEYGRVIPLHERNASTAAWHLAKPGVVDSDPEILKRYLVKWLGMKEYEVTDAHKAALWHLVTEEMERVPSQGRSRRRREWKDVWLSNHTSTVNYLKINIPKRLKADDNVPRAGAIRSANLRSVFKENYKKPYYLEDFPGGKEGVELLEWFTPETRTRFLEEVRRLKILPRKQYQVLELGLKGKGDAEIGHELGIETSTVQSHRSVALKQPRLLLLAKKWRKKRL